MLQDNGLYIHALPFHPMVMVVLVNLRGNFHCRLAYFQSIPTTGLICALQVIKSGGFNAGLAK